MKQVIKARAPLRLGLAGGGTDVSPYTEQYGGYVLNGCIDRYAYAVIQTLDEPEIRFISTDMDAEQIMPSQFPLKKTKGLELHKAVYESIIRKYNGGRPIALELSTYCDAPPGSGLGASSTVVVAMIRAFVELLNLPLDDYSIAKLAYQIERVDCNLKGGRQDQYSATFGGFNFMEFYGDGRAIVNQLRIKNWIICELEASLLLYFTGTSRESGTIIADQSENVKLGVEKTIDAMHGMKQEALIMKECLLKGDFDGFVSSIKSGWMNKKRSANLVSNPQIEQIFDAAIKAGAVAGKVSGAGGGGFMWFFVPVNKRMNVVKTLNEFGGVVSNCHFTKHGSQAWKL